MPAGVPCQGDAGSILAGTAPQPAQACPPFAPAGPAAAAVNCADPTCVCENFLWRHVNLLSIVTYEPRTEGD